MEDSYSPFFQKWSIHFVHFLKNGAFILSISVDDKKWDSPLNFYTDENVTEEDVFVLPLASHWLLAAVCRHPKPRNFEIRVMGKSGDPFPICYCNSNFLYEGRIIALVKARGSRPGGVLGGESFVAKCRVINVYEVTNPHYYKRYRDRYQSRFPRRSACVIHFELLAWFCDEDHWKELWKTNLNRRKKTGKDNRHSPSSRSGKFKRACKAVAKAKKEGYTEELFRQLIHENPGLLQSTAVQYESTTHKRIKTHAKISAANPYIVLKLGSALAGAYLSWNKLRKISSISNQWSLSNGLQIRSGISEDLILKATKVFYKNGGLKMSISVPTLCNPYVSSKKLVDALKQELVALYAPDSKIWKHCLLNPLTHEKNPLNISGFWHERVKTSRNGRLKIPFPFDVNEDDIDIKEEHYLTVFMGCRYDGVRVSNIPTKYNSKHITNIVVQCHMYTSAATYSPYVGTQLAIVIANDGKSIVKGVLKTASEESKTLPIFEFVTPCGTLKYHICFHMLVESDKSAMIKALGTKQWNSRIWCSDFAFVDCDTGEVIWFDDQNKYVNMKGNGAL